MIGTRYKSELKFDIQRGTSFFKKAVSQVKTEEDYKVFHAEAILDNFRLVTYREVMMFHLLEIMLR